MNFKQRMILHNLNLDYNTHMVNYEKQTDRTLNMIMNKFVEKYRDIFNTYNFILEYQDNIFGVLTYYILKNIQGVYPFNLRVYGKIKKTKHLFYNKKDIITKWRAKHKDAFEKREGEKLTYTPIFMEAVAKAIKDYPGMNISVEGDFIIKKKNINLGMAASLPNGNLIVPVIKNADQLNLVGMAKAVNDLGGRAKAGKLKPDDTQGGTYTVTNVGTFGSVFGTPILNQPQVGILALGAIRKMPAVIETPEGDFIGIRQKMFLSHSYDHRVVDGALGGSFVKRVAEYLEAFDVNRDV